MLGQRMSRGLRVLGSLRFILTVGGFGLTRGMAPSCGEREGGMWDLGGVRRLDQLRGEVRLGLHGVRGRVGVGSCRRMLRRLHVGKLGLGLRSVLEVGRRGLGLKLRLSRYLSLGQWWLGVGYRHLLLVLIRLEMKLRWRTLKALRHFSMG